MSKTNNIWGFTSNFLKIIFISLILVGCSAIDNTNNTDNTGTPWDGIIIKTADDLVALSGKDVTENILFDADIDMKGKTFAGIKSFTGTIIDGNGKKILNLKIEYPANVGLILSVPKGTTTEIKNLTIESGSIKSTALYRYAGAFIADSKGTVTLTGLTNKASITGGNAVGGMIGQAVGGMIGQAIGTVNINNVKNTGDISGNYVGGMIGYASSTVTIKNTANIGAITSGNNVDDYVNDYVGGMIGYASSTVTIKNTANIGDISGNNVDDYVGGMIGYASSTVTIDNVKNTGDISGNYVGGMIGRFANTSSTYTINTSHSYTQRLVGTFAVNSFIINNSYYLSNDSPGILCNAPLTATEFKNPASFVGWDFDTIWKMGTSYPELR